MSLENAPEAPSAPMVVSLDNFSDKVNKELDNQILELFPRNAKAIDKVLDKKAITDSVLGAYAQINGRFDSDYDLSRVIQEQIDNDGEDEYFLTYDYFNMPSIHTHLKISYYAKLKPNTETNIEIWCQVKISTNLENSAHYSIYAMPFELDEEKVFGAFRCFSLDTIKYMTDNANAIINTIKKKCMPEHRKILSRVKIYLE